MGKSWGIGEKGVNLWRRRPIGGLATGMECIIFSEETMAKGNSWKTRNRTNADFGREGRKILKRELKSVPQFTLEELYITPFTLRKRFDEDGRWEYDMSASERRAFLQKEGDAGRFRV